MPPSSSDSTRPEPSSLPSSHWASWRRVISGLARRPRIRGKSIRDRADLRPAPHQRLPPVSSVLRSAARHSARYRRHRRAAARPDYDQLSAEFPAPARWRCRGRWTSSARSAAASKIAPLCSTRSTAQMTRTTASLPLRIIGTRSFRPGNCGLVTSNQRSIFPKSIPPTRSGPCTLPKSSTMPRSMSSNRWASI